MTVRMTSSLSRKRERSSKIVVLVATPRRRSPRGKPGGPERRLPCIDARWPSLASRSAPGAIGLVRPHRDLDAIPRAELGHQAGEMGLDRAEADVELVGDLAVRPSVGDGEQDLLLAARQRFGGLHRQGARGGGGGRGGGAGGGAPGGT